MKRFFSILVTGILMIGLLTAAAPAPRTTFTLIQGLPASMRVGETRAVIIQVNSNQQILSAQASLSSRYAAKGVLAVQGVSEVNTGTSSTISVTFKARNSTTRTVNEVTPVNVVVSVQHGGGHIAIHRYVFKVAVR
jgi:hypothetical protein